MESKNTPQPKYVYHFAVNKVNKQDTIYKGKESNPTESIITELVKVERYQGYSNAYNLGLYFRIKNASSWAKSTKLSGLFKTETPGFYYGDIREPNKKKTLLLFKVDEHGETLTVWEFEQLYYPSKKTIENLVKSL
jgi:hypothetical protein